jgi:DNA-binding transcriptional LysR family regulator
MGVVVEQPGEAVQVPGQAPDSIELRHLRYFLAVGQARSFTRAADALFVGQPTLSIAVRQLEAIIGEQLLIRGGRHVELTDAGRAFFHSAELTLAAVDRAVLRAREAARARPTVRLFSPYASNDTARSILRELRAQSPDVTVERLHGGSRASVEALLTGRADVAVGGTGDLPDGIAAELARDERLVAVLPPDVALATADAVSLADLAAYPVYLPSAEVSPAWTGFVERMFSRAGVRFRAVGGDCSGPVVFTDVVAAGDAVAVTVQSDDLGRGVTTRPIRDEHASYPWFVMWLATDPAATVTWVLDAARGVSDRADWLATAGRSSPA